MMTQRQKSVAMLVTTKEPKVVAILLLDEN
jgi:hypothetical protein